MTEQGNTNSSANVWLMQWDLQHYRIPVWDRLVERGAGTYQLKVLGSMENGQAVGGESRPYFCDIATKEYRCCGLTIQCWPGASALMRQEKPDVVIFVGNPWNMSVWKLPRLCHRLKASAVVWSKIHGHSKIPGTKCHFIKRRFFSRFDVAICYGQQSLEELLGYDFPEQRAHAAQNTIDTSIAFDQTDRLIKRGRQLKQAAGLADARILLCVGRFSENKRQGDLLDAWMDLRQSIPGLALVLVGHGPMLEEIRKRANQIDPGRIVVTGRVPLGDDYAWAAAADAVIIPGAVGLFLNVSMAFGRPTVIADEYGSDAEILKHNQTGWRYPRGDIRAMSQTIQQVIAGGPEVERISRDARRTMRDRVSIDHMVQSIDLAIRQAIDISRERKVK